MKKIISLLSVGLILVFSLCGCGSADSTATSAPAEFEPFVVYEDDNIEVKITDYDDEYGEWDFEFYNKTDYDMECYSDKCTIDGEYAGDCFLWSDTMAPGMKAKCSNVSIYNEDYEYYTMGEGFNIDLSLVYTYESEDWSVYESNTISFELTPDMFGY